MPHLRILQTHPDFFAIDKPAGFVVHASAGSLRKSHSLWNVSLLLPEQTGERAFTPHRLDRSTSGILLVARSQSAARDLTHLFQERRINKKYIAIVRGHAPEKLLIDRPLLARPTQELQEAQTEIRALFRWEEPLLDGTKRTLSLIEAIPTTGRYHQIRRHLAGASLPILGDPLHGDKKFMRVISSFWREHLWLRSTSISFDWQGSPLHILAPWRKSWHVAFERMGFCPWLGSLSPTKEAGAWTTERAVDQKYDEREPHPIPASPQSDW